MDLLCSDLQQWHATTHSAFLLYQHKEPSVPSLSPFSEAGYRPKTYLQSSQLPLNTHGHPDAEQTAAGQAGHRHKHRILVPGRLASAHAPIEPQYAMTTPSTSSVARTQPIAIASRKPRHLEPSLEPSSSGIRSQLSASMSSTTSAESGTNTRSRKDRPCDACRRRKSRCVIKEGQTSCVLCQFHTQECTFVQSPQPRKRKLNTEGKEESVAKRRYAKQSFFPLLFAAVSSFLLVNAAYVLARASLICVAQIPR